jgi:Lon protease (S16) C-terminal proteolytic domain
MQPLMNAALLLLLLLFPLLCRAQDPAPPSAPPPPTLSSLTEAAFTKWLTGTEWKGTLDGKGAHLWFATPGIVIVRWEFNPGVWDCRAAALIPGEKGKLKWRWNPDAVASCTVALAEDLKTLALEDGLMGKWTLAVSSRKPCTVSGGKLAAMGAGGFSAWLEKQGLRWRDAKLNFGKGREATYEGFAPGKYEIISPGVVEIYPLKDRSYCLLAMFTPALEGALLYGPWGVSGAKVKGAPATAVIPAPLFNEPDPKFKTLPEMNKEDFEKWLVGTEWEHTENNYTSWYWFPAPGFVTWRGHDKHLGFGSVTEAAGKVTWKFAANPDSLNTFTLTSSLITGQYVWEGGKKQCSNRLLARRMPFPMDAPSSEKTAALISQSRVLLSENSMTFPTSGIARWRWQDGRTADLRLQVAGPGVVMYVWPNDPADSGLLCWRSPTSMRLYWRWGAGLQTVEALNANATNPPDNTGGLFDMGLSDTPAIPLKSPTASVNALVVMDLGGGRTAGALSKLSLTALALTTQDAATIGFNQPVGDDMKKALREVTRFHGIRQQGWPRGQKMELSFADKYSPKDGPSAAVACALLLESAIRGVPLQPDFAVTGDMNADGSVQPIGGVAGKLRGATKGGCRYAAIPAGNITSATDLALTDGAAPFLALHVFSISTFDDAAKLALLQDAALKAVIDSYQVIAAKIKTAPASLRHPDTVTALRNLAKTAPSHLSVRLLLALAEDKLPAALSPAGSLHAIELAITDALEGTSAELLAKSNLDRGKTAAARGKLQQLRPKLDKRTHPLADAWITWCQSVERLTATAGSLDDSLVNAHKTAVKRLQAEEEKLRTNADFREDLLRQ